MTSPPPGPTGDRMQIELGFISELSMIVASTSELQPILDWIADRTRALFGADECNLKLRGATADAMQTVVFNRRDTGPEAGSRSWTELVRLQVMGWLLREQLALVTNDLSADPRFPGMKGTETRIRALLAVPLIVDGRITGMLAVSHTTPGRDWDASEVQLLNIVASHSAATLEKARLRTEAEAKDRLEREKAAMEKELGLARDIQMRLVPAAPLACGTWRITGQLVPARQVGGDYFDYFPLADGRIAFAIADVSGKGVPAALLVSSVQGSLRAFCDGRRSPADAIAEVNRAITRSAASGRFVTLFYGELEAASGRLRYVNAGHNFPLLRRGDGSLESLREGGLPLGILADGAYVSGEALLAGADALLLYSDGISEAMNEQREDFGEARLEHLWKACATLAPESAVRHVLDEVEAFRGAAAQSDDITAVILAPGAE